MEPAKIDWKTLQSQWVFVEDQLYEHINAPKWFDFSAPQQDDDPTNDDDVAWFCRPDCNHPTTAEDFLNLNSSSSSTPNSKSNKKSANSAYKTLLLGERGFGVKRRGLGLTRSPTPRPNFNYDSVHRSQDSENQNPNLSTPVVNQHTRSLKEAIKSSSEKKKPAVDELPPGANDTPRLKSTLSARNLLAGRNIFSHITEFVGELKKLALRAKETEDDSELEKPNVEKNGEGTNELSVGEEKERKPSLEVDKGRSDSEGTEMSISKEKPSCRRVVEAENVPISLNTENLRPKGENIIPSQIRTSPPTPQCFSATKGTNRRPPPPLKETRARLKERQILKEVMQTSEETADKGRSHSDFDGREAKMLDLFWLLKPCTPSS